MKRNRLFIRISRYTAGVFLAVLVMAVSSLLTGCGDRKSGGTKVLTNSASTQGEETNLSQTDESSQAEESSREDGSSEGIDRNQALEIALGHAGIAEQDTKFHSAREDVEDGQRVFEVEFISSEGGEYEYELDAQDGTIISFEYDAESLYRKEAVSDAEMIPESQVMQVVLERVPGAEAKDVAIFKKEDDGRMEYEAHLVFEEMKYEYKIDAYSGDLMEWEGELLGR